MTVPLSIYLIVFIGVEMLKLYHGSDKVTPLEREELDNI